MSKPNTHYIGPVTGIEVYRNDVVVVRDGRATKPEPAPRGDVKEFSRASRARLAFVASNTDVVFTTMVTLTYPADFPSDGATVKAHLHAFLNKISRHLEAPQYLWFLEFQRRGAPHIHVLLDWKLSRDADIKTMWRRYFAHLWYYIVGSGDEKHLRAGTRVEELRSPEGGARYAVKYAMKMHQKLVPDGFESVGRFWGHSRGVKPRALMKDECTEDDVRGVLDGWKYAPSDERPVYHTLYNQAHRFLAWADGLDETEIAVYNRSQSDCPKHLYPTAPERKKQDGTSAVVVDSR